MTVPKRAVILAAGRGSRLGGLVDEVPKCLVRLGGVTLLEWQIRALEEAGVDMIVAVCGYRCEAIAAMGVETVVNPRWAETNMVASLLCARELIEVPVLVSYADIVYTADIVRQIGSASGSFAISYDTDWLELWSRRFDDPLSDAESFRLDSAGRVSEIGSRAESVDDIEGQYMGLLRLDKTALEWIDRFLQNHSDPHIEDRIDMTNLMNGLIQSGHPIDAVGVRGGWCEVDSPRDLQVAHEWLAAGRLGSPPIGRP